MKDYGERKRLTDGTERYVKGRCLADIPHRECPRSLGNKVPKNRGIFGDRKILCESCDNRVEIE